MNRRELLLISLILIFMSGCHRSPCDDLGLESPVGEKLEKSFTSTEGRFRFGLPSRVIVPAPDGKETEMKEFKWLVINRGQYRVTYYDYPRDVESSGESQKVFDRLRDLTVAKGPGKVEVDKELMLSGHPGREIRINDEKGTDIQRFYLVGPRLYTVTLYVPHTLDCAFDDSIKVLDTFELVGENAQARNDQGNTTSPTPGQSGHSPSLTTN